MAFQPLKASHGLPVWAIMVFPALFAAGMSLVDTADNILMLGAYGWAFIKPVRKLYYNMTITLVSVLVALLVGGVEALGLLQDRLALKGPFWDRIGSLNGNLGNRRFCDHWDFRRKLGRIGRDLPCARV